ncbi:MAG: phosphoenolpyruvate--protein phosphotransferase [Lachnospiraceae bacterium]|nr:phosphoenolpyruvate--protein phosphotransferase [Lachnospiraceae bacterium]
MKSYKGNPVSKGVEIGKVYKYVPYHASVGEELIEEAQVADELQKYGDAKEKALHELNRLKESMGKSDQDKAAILGAHIEILKDPAMDQQIGKFIKKKMYNAKYAIDASYKMFIGMLEKVQDDLIRERIADMKDVRNRTLRCLDGEPEKNLSTLSEPVIVIAKDLLPSDTASLNRKMVLGIITEVGGATSHTAIIARSYEIPAILGVKNAMELFVDGEEVIIDAIAGNVLTQIEEEIRQDYDKKSRIFKEQALDTKKYLHVEPVTKDGERIYVNLNIGSTSEEELEHAVVSDGVGLFRSEFLYMGRDKLPDEEEQYKIYTKVLEAFAGKTVILRTMDIGGDKKLDCMELPVEENPFLGKRALRLSFAYPDIFLTQLKAALRAAVNGDLWIMFPMVESMDDIRRAKQYVEQAKKELSDACVPYGSVKIGIMVEIPSIAVIAEQAAKEVDFASIGTNDLTQYTLAVDRMNPELGDFYQKYHPAVLKLIRNVIEQFNKAGKHVGVCGELGGDELGSVILMGFGLRQLSMGYASVAQIKKIITNITIEDTKGIADNVCAMSTSAEIEAYVTGELKAKGL